MRASAMGNLGRYQLKPRFNRRMWIAVRSGHANWEEVAQLYDALFALSGSPVVAINRALAIAEIDGAARGACRHAADGEADSRLAEYQPYWAARAELLAKTGDADEARQAYEIAIGLERDQAVRRFLQRRQSILTD